MNSGETRPALREFVARYRVYWQVWPEWALLRDHRKEQVGFRLELCGVHPPGCKPTPGCEQCREIYAGLRDIAAWVRPVGAHDTAYEVLSFDAALHYGANSQGLPAVVLAILIVHRGTYDRPVDASEVRCLRAMQERLRELGAMPDRPPVEVKDSRNRETTEPAERGATKGAEA